MNRGRKNAKFSENERNMEEIKGRTEWGNLSSDLSFVIGLFILKKV